MYDIGRLRLEYYIYLAKKISNELKRQDIRNILKIRRAYAKVREESKS